MDRVPALRRLMLADIPPWQGAIWTAVAVAVPAGLRWAIDSGGSGTPFVTFYPAILLAALFLGWKYGIATAVLTGIVVNRVLRYEPLEFSDPRDVMVISLFALTCAILIYVAAMLRRLVRDQHEAAQREALLNLELLHRVKNMLATVSSIASMTARHANPEDFIEAFNGRIAALARASELLAAGTEVQCEVRRLVESAIVPFRTEDNFRIFGPQIELPRATCVPLALALHELCTNAAKYGALSVSGGTVTLEWEQPALNGRVLIRWREDGGPPVPAKREKGMGSRLLKRQPGLADVRLYFRKDGVACEIEIDGTEPATA